MTNTRSFFLYAPADYTSSAPTHLRDPDGRPGILCADSRYRYDTFRVVGWVPASSATCQRCRVVAEQQQTTV